VDKILIFAILKQQLLQTRETEISFRFLIIIFTFSLSKIVSNNFYSVQVLRKTVVPRDVTLPLIPIDVNDDITQFFYLHFITTAR